jgi:hypothetical protein
MRTPDTTRRATPRVVAVVLAALVTVPAPAGPASAAPTPTPTPAAAAAAGQPLSFSVQPSSRTGPGNRPFFSYDLAPGGSVTDYIGVTNLGTAPLTLSVYGSDAYNTATGGYDLLPAARPPVDVGSWVRLAQNTVTVPARSRADVPFTVTAPANATPGDHAGGIVASITSSTADGTGHTTRLEQRVGSRIYLRVTGPLRPALRIDDLRADHRPGLAPFTGALVVSYTVRNTGNTRIAASPRLAVTGPFGLPAGGTTLDTLPELLPGSVLRRTVTVPDVPALLRLTATLSVEPATATLPGSAAAAPDASAPDAARSTVSAWALSWWYLPVLVAAVAWLVRRRFARRRPPPARRSAPVPVGGSR